MEANANVNGSPYVEGRIKEIKAMGGNKRKVDSEAEYKALQDLLSGDLSRSDVQTIKEEMENYEKFAKEQEAKTAADKVSDEVRKFVKEIAKRFGNKKEIDTMDEAQALIRQLDDPTISKADREYLEGVLKDSGYASMFTSAKNTETVEKRKEEEEKATPANVIPENTKETTSKDVENKTEAEVEKDIEKDVENPAKETPNAPAKKKPAPKKPVSGTPNKMPGIKSEEKEPTLPKKINELPGFDDAWGRAKKRLKEPKPNSIF